MSKIYLIPVSVFLIFQLTFIGTYIAAVLQGHVVPTVPYISDAATYSPESCVFGQLINIGSVLLGITIYVRYRQVLELYEHHPDLGSNILKHNRLAVWFGLASCLGISFVANFQETNVRIVHFVGAFCCFGCGTLYFWMQALISYMLYPMAGTKLRAHLRLGMAVFCTILFILLAVTGLMSHIMFKGQDPRKCILESVDGQLDKDIDFCLICLALLPKKELTDANAIQCNVCDRPVHLTCVGMTANFFRCKHCISDSGIPLMVVGTFTWLARFPNGL